MTKSESGAIRSRYGIGEWYGRLFTTLSPEERRRFAEAQKLAKSTRPVFPCPPRGGVVACSKPGGVCTIRQYERSEQTGAVRAAAGAKGALVSTCPARFEEGGTTYRWIGEQLLGCGSPLVVGEVKFLERDPSGVLGAADVRLREDVGSIDNILVCPDREPMHWCALEIQAVYFSGSKMSEEFQAMSGGEDPGIPFPVGKRRPDYRSSGPKRLMPQLQIKVPTLRRWGKKMAVVVDEAFFSALGRMDAAPDTSNADIAWFVVGYDIAVAQARLVRRRVHLTTLEHAVEGLTAGHPVSLDVFESRIRDKLNRAPSRPPISGRDR